MDSLSLAHNDVIWCYLDLDILRVVHSIYEMLMGLSKHIHLSLK